MLLAAVDIQRRRRFCDALLAGGMDVATTFSARQTLQRVFLVCSDSALRWRRDSDFDLVVIEADLLDQPDDFVRRLRHAGFRGPILVTGHDATLSQTFLDAGVTEYLVVPTDHAEDLLPCLQRHTGVSAALKPRTWRTLLRSQEGA